MSSNRFLVIVRAGDASRHPEWTRSSASRTWDLVVSYFGTDPVRYQDDVDRRVDDKGLKWHGLHALLTREDFWRDYDFVWLPDDDLAVDQTVVDRLFAFMDGLDLDLAQPTLDWNSYYSHALTLRWPSFSVRFSNFIEIMAPCFKRTLLERCVPTFAESLSGWGFDYVWPRFLGEGVQRSALLDEVSVTHTRPIGGPSYDRLKTMGISPVDEARSTRRRHGVPQGTRQTITAAIDRTGRFLHGADPRTSATIDALMRRDWTEFAAYRKAAKANADLGTPQAPMSLPSPSIAELGEVVAANLPVTRPWSAGATSR
jgi:hypothetical protein